MTALIVLPGLDGTGALHGDFLLAASEHFASVTVLSYPAQRALGYAELERLVRAALPTATPFVLLGESFSGPIALSIAADPPPHLIGTVLSTSFAGRPIPALAWCAPLLALAPVRAVPTRLLSRWLLGRWASPALTAQLRGALRQVAPAVLRQRAAAALRSPRMQLAPIAHPVLYLQATQDRLQPATAARAVRDSVARCEVVRLPGPHLLLQAAPRDCARVVGDFARRLAPAAPRARD